MKDMPSDWKDDQKLWETLGKAPEVRAPSNFTYLVHQKLLEPSPSRESHWNFSIGSLLRGWVGGFVTATACFALFLAVTGNNPLQKSAVAQGSTPEEMTALVQNYELIQDLEVIENLDKLDL
jgi:hypothetical protein